MIKTSRSEASGYEASGYEASGHEASGQSRETRKSDTSLDRRYGRIAISALVAALPYRSESKNARCAPVQAQD